MQASEFGDEYEDWVESTAKRLRPRLPDVTLSEMQHAPMLCVLPDETVEEVVSLMNREHQSAVLVVEEGELLGIFTERDVLQRVVPRIDGLFMSVREVMTERPEVLSHAALLSVAIRRLASGNYHHLPVVDDHGRPRAIVSLRTLLAHLIDVFPDDILNAPPERHSYPPTREGP